MHELLYMSVLSTVIHVHVCVALQHNNNVLTSFALPLLNQPEAHIHFSTFDLLHFLEYSIQVWAVSANVYQARPDFKFTNIPLQCPPQGYWPNIP